jgi:hypothetical protein
MHCVYMTHQIYQVHDNNLINDIFNINLLYNFDHCTNINIIICSIMKNVCICSLKYNASIGPEDLWIYLEGFSKNSWWFYPWILSLLKMYVYRPSSQMLISWLLIFTHNNQPLVGHFQASPELEICYKTMITQIIISRTKISPSPKKKQKNI